MGGDIKISELDVLGESLGRGNCLAGIKGRITPGEMTFARVSTDDTLGVIKTYVGQGRFTDDPLECDGGVGVCEVPRLQALLYFLCHNGFEHHVAMNRGNHAAALEEAFGRYLGWDVYNHNSPAVHAAFELYSTLGQQQIESSAFVHDGSMRHRRTGEKPDGQDPRRRKARGFFSFCQHDPCLAAEVFLAPVTLGFS